MWQADLQSGHSKVAKTEKRGLRTVSVLLRSLYTARVY